MSDLRFLLHGAQRGATWKHNELNTSEIMTESKEKLNRLRTKRGGYRGVCTKLAKEADELLHLPGDVDVDRCEIIRSLLEEKLKILSEIDEEILGLCEVKDIEQEILQNINR